MPDEPTGQAQALAPFVTAAACIAGPAGGAAQADHIKRVVAIALDLQTEAEAASKDRPVRSFKVTGILEMGNTNAAHRTQFGVNSGRGQDGADQMWTEYGEDEAAAQRTRAVLQSLVGKKVTAVKETFYEYEANGEPKMKDNKPQTRPRLKPGSLQLEDGTVVDFASGVTAAPTAAAPAAAPVAVVAPQPQAAAPVAAPVAAVAPQAPAAAPAPGVVVDRQAAWGWLNQHLGAELAQQTWTQMAWDAQGATTQDELNRVHGLLAQPVAA